MVKGFIEWEHSEEDGLVLRIKPALGQLVNQDVRQHASAAQKELLLTMKILIDMAVKQMDDKDSSGKQGSTKIKVE
jgi:hypothetical protein